MTIFVDCDGVLADFDKAAEKLLGMPARAFEDEHGSDEFWRRIGESERFYRNLDLMPEAEFLMDSLRHKDPIILTGSPAQLRWYAYIDKNDWAREKFGKNQKVIICQSKNKFMFAEPGDVIIDDWPKHRKSWEDVGGIWIPYENDAVEIVKRLRDEGYI